MSFSTIQSSRRCNTAAAIRNVGVLGGSSIGSEWRARSSGPAAHESKREHLQITICSWCDPHRPEKACRRRGVRVNYGICLDCLEEQLLRLAERPAPKQAASRAAPASAPLTGAASAG